MRHMTHSITTLMLPSAVRVILVVVPVPVLIRDRRRHVVLPWCRRKSLRLCLMRRLRASESLWLSLALVEAEKSFSSAAIAATRHRQRVRWRFVTLLLAKLLVVLPYLLWLVLSLLVPFHITILGHSHNMLLLRRQRQGRLGHQWRRQLLDRSCAQRLRGKRVRRAPSLRIGVQGRC